MPIILVKHSSPQIVTGIAPENWVLSTEGQRRCKLLADRIAGYRPTSIITSEEAKAIETGKLLSEHLGIPFASAADLQEQDRSNVPQLQTGQFISTMELAFRRPDELVLGKETISAAADRFDRALQNLLTDHVNETLAIVTHGAVLAQWLAPKSTESGFELWRKMGLPSLAVLESVTMKVIERVDQIK